MEFYRFCTNCQKQIWHKSKASLRLCATCLCKECGLKKRSEDNASKGPFIRNCPICEVKIEYRNLRLRSEAERKSFKCKACESKRKKSSGANRDKILELHGLGFSVKEICDELRITHGTIYRQLSEYGLTPNVNLKVLDVVSDTEAKCHKCNTVKSLKSFKLSKDRFGRKYQLTMCKTCLSDQERTAANIDIAAYMNNKMREIKRRASRLGVGMNLDTDYMLGLYELHGIKCFYTGVDMVAKVAKSERAPDGLSVDRVVPENGYVKGNVVFCTNKANSVKTNLTLQEMQDWLPSWHQRITQGYESGILYSREKE